MTEDVSHKRRFLLAAMGAGSAYSLMSWSAAAAAPATKSKPLAPLKKTGAQPRNIVVILTDDHRYDAMGFMKGQSFLETPNLDRIAGEGVQFKNAFVTTALCSPSRASIFTGLYAHQHRVVDNNHAIDPSLVFFPQHLQKAGYETAFIGKWHMGLEGDDPQPGFDHWVSFKGQGTYLPNPDGLNIDGEHMPQRGYITDELTDYALDWLNKRGKDRPYMLFLSHKAVHSEFIPAERHKGRYDKAQFQYPASMNISPDNPEGRPMWVQNQRNSWHGVDFPYHSKLSIADYYKRYAETLLAVDESAGRLMDALAQRGELDDTLILYMGDNGFAFGEHGLIDKRTAYEESMRVPMIARCPALFKGGRVVKEVVANIDVAPSLLAAAGLAAPKSMEGMDFLPLARGEKRPWRDALLYEYYWERNFPQTPTVHAIRGDQYKYIHYHGVWDVDELYDLQADPLEQQNLIFSPGHEGIIDKLNKQLFERLEATGGMSIPLAPDSGERNVLRRSDGPPQAVFPPQFIKTLTR